jgi:hypothetical protein
MTSGWAGAHPLKFVSLKPGRVISNNFKKKVAEIIKAFVTQRY